MATVVTTLTCLMGGGCMSAEEPDQVGTWVALDNESGEPLCPGTVAYSDRVLGEAFRLLEEEPPSHRFVEYRWGPRGYYGLASPRSTGVSIEAGSPVHEHELVHAAHLQAWPRAPAFLEEGLAEFLGDSFSVQDAGVHRPFGEELDAALSTPVHDLDYGLAWLVVSQIVLEHGVSGLRDFWFELGPSSSMAEVRQTYTRLFGGSLDELVQPFPVTIGGEQVPFGRGVCWIQFCTGEPLAWENERIRGVGVSGCDDVDAVSPSLSQGPQFPWKDYVVEGIEPVVAEAAPGVYVEVEPCGVLLCDHHTVRDEGLAQPPPETWEQQGRYRVRVATDSDELAPGTEPTFELIPGA